MCNIRRFSWLRELYEADFHKPGTYVEAGEYGLTRGTCLLACRLELDAVAGLLSISWRVLGGADFSVFFFSRFFFRFFFPFERTLRAASTRPPCLIYLSTSIVLERMYIMQTGAYH